ncbi:hypothetical protein B0A50_03175 [Salinomyces thailandicus]|uniref:Uncharacterized protein n=1 Tax=Salinomyces thailandicus TaxID=706561 RepID=A0A4U0U3Z3_9PEZI|nr:hypothetical protein B0A50_03175 [Salinomyces thailandica]
MPSASELRETAEGPLDPNTPQSYEIRERQQLEQPSNTQRPAEATNAPTNEDYEPNPSASIKLEPERQHIVDSILRLYGGSGKEDSTGEQDMRVYAKKAVYDDVWSYCDTRYKVAGQWYGIPAVMKSSETTAIEVVSSTPVADMEGKEPGAIVFKMKHAWTPRLAGKTWDVNHFVTLSLEKATEEDGEGPGERVKYHKDQWNEKDYSHEGLGKAMKTLNGDFATIGTRPPKDL